MLDAYGLEKLATEELCMHYDKDFGINCRIARFHNIYGAPGWVWGWRDADAWKAACPLPCLAQPSPALAHPLPPPTRPLPPPPLLTGPYGTWKGGREKAPAAFCRKALTAVDEIEMWGDGKQTRSFTFIDDCVEGILRITKSDFRQPLNLGSCEMVRWRGCESKGWGANRCLGGCGAAAVQGWQRMDVTTSLPADRPLCLLPAAAQVSMNGMMDMVMNFDGMKKGIKHIPGPEGVRGRNSDNKLILEKLGWEPTIRLEVSSTTSGLGLG